MDSAVAGFEIGDRVYGYMDLGRMGAYAEYTTALPTEIALIPEGMSFNEAASLPVVAITAITGLFNMADVKPGQTVLVNGAAGGVGTIAVQLVRARNANVVGTASSYNHSFLRGLGVHEAIDYNDIHLKEIGREFDVIFDAVGGSRQADLFALVRKGGTLVSITAPPRESLDKRYSINIAFFWANPHRA